ncbi:germin-like protein subfamily 1 member 14 [Coffea eugenioides]|uniref:germin-like protein subfamily 1 member 14 n=1 Tax=Coffea eugenioides TaxID=49369 RepID=UPI000F60A3D3|nr:germin-like protein subfamily 1 member 14 [Coffea eugenioides]
MGAPFLITIATMALFSSLAIASDPSPLQDFCVAINNPKTAVFVNGKICKDPKVVNANDFFFHGFNIPGNTNNPVGSNVTRVLVDNLPGLNTFGISLARIDFAPYGVNTPHTHPRATEVIFAVEGTLAASFVTSNPPNNMKNRLFTKVLNPGDVFVFPQGLLHFIQNLGKTKALAFSAFSSQNPGVNTIANVVFGTEPPISLGVLTKAFQVDKKVIDALEAQFS